MSGFTESQVVTEGLLTPQRLLRDPKPLLMKIRDFAVQLRNAPDFRSLRQTDVTCCFSVLFPNCSAHPRIQPNQ